ncbi:MAG: magnesium/cobalt transporter CorA [Bacteroidales bacterium]|jgi:magnesium transporter|nr:magnesium/cobalt transporter CorA [Bacteroidales bacterium]
MARFIKDRSPAAGKAPGSLVLIGRQKMEKPQIRIMDYSADHMNESELESIKDCEPFLKTDSVSWINVFGIHEMEMIQDAGNIFGLDNLMLEDILNTDQIPKYVAGENYDAFILKMLDYDPDSNRIRAEQLTLILGENFILTLQERKGDVFNPIRERIRNHKGRVRLNNNDYLAYALMDIISDNYLSIIESLGRQIEDLEERIFSENNKDIAQNIYSYKIELSYLRKNIRPFKEGMMNLLKNEDSFFSPDTLNFMADLNESVTHANDSIELYSSLVSDQLNTHNTLVNNKMNQVMKVLTIFASIFIPLTFIAGVYGMNFRYIPELELKSGYFLFWILIIIIGISFIIFFKKKKWL